MKTKRTSKLKRARTERAKPRSVQRVVIHRLVKEFKAEEKRIAEMAKGETEKTPTSDWFRGFVEGTANALGWTSDRLADV